MKRYELGEAIEKYDFYILILLMLIIVMAVR